jgi:hypothetical protein
MFISKTTGEVGVGLGAGAGLGAGVGAGLGVGLGAGLGAGLGVPPGEFVPTNCPSPVTTMLPLVLIAPVSALISRAPTLRPLGRLKPLFDMCTFLYGFLYLLIL